MDSCPSCHELHSADTELCPVCDVKRLRRELEGARGLVSMLERELRDAEKLAGCRPGDGSDQPSLFDVAQPSLFLENDHDFRRAV